MTERIIVLIDMDCFYCQVESKLNPSLNGQPMAVVQYNQWKGGGIIAVNYEARDRGVTRHMRGKEAKEQCPEIILVTVPTIRDKADLTRYRDASREVFAVLCRFSDCVQRASIDEAYIDITSQVEERFKTFSEFNSDKWKSTFVVGYSTDGSNDEDERQNGLKSWLEDCESIENTPSMKLAVGALLVEELRMAVFEETGFRCSAGIAHNKILAKLACGLHKPNRQTVLPQESVEGLFKTLPVKKIRNLGGKFGDDIIEKLGCKTMSDLTKFTERELQNRYDEKNGTWLYNIARGYDYEPVTARLVSKSIGCCKQFPGKQALVKSEDVYHWLNKLTEELSERLLEDETMNKRRAQLLTVSTDGGSKSTALSSYNIEKIVTQAESLLKKLSKMDSSGFWFPPMKFLGLSAGKFTEIATNKIDKFFKISYSSETKPSTPQASVELTDCEKVVNTENGEESRLSFFEKMFAKEIGGSAKKLKLVPDLTRNDLFIDSDDSQSSMKKMNQVSSDEPLRDSIKKNLFTPTESITASVHSNTKVEHKESSLIHNKVVKNDITKSIKKKSNDSSNKSIASFFGKSKNESWTKPEELFPDLNEVDDELLSFLPESYRNKILKMKKDTMPSNHCRMESDISLDKCNASTSNNNDCDNLEMLTETSENKINDVSNISINNDQNEKSSDSISNGVSDKNLVKCEECGEEVLNYEFHMDMHLAKKLHKELNSFSTVITKKINNSTEKEKKKRRSNNKPSIDNSKKLKSIDTFFVKK